MGPITGVFLNAINDPNNACPAVAPVVLKAIAEVLLVRAISM
jgi:hypothetical protein